MTKIGGGESPYHVNMENNQSGVQRQRTSMDASDEKKGEYTIPVSIYKPSELGSYLFSEKIVYMKPEDQKVYQKFLNQGYEPSQFLSDDSEGKPNLTQGRGTAAYVEGTQKF